MLINPTTKHLIHLKKIKTTNDPIFYIINRDNHWTAIYFKNNGWCELDSFNRDLLKNFDDTKFIKKQKINEENCGQRLLLKLFKLLS